MRRKFESADPLRRGSRRPPAPALRSAAARTAVQAAAAAQRQPPATTADLTQQQPPAAMNGPGFQEFPLKMCSEEDLNNARYHIIKFHGRKGVNPAEQFVPPIRMHRKDPKQLQVVAGENGEGEDGAMDGVENGDVKAEGAEAGAAGPNAAGAANGGSNGGAGSNGGGGGGGEGDDARDAPKRRPFGRKRKLRQIHGGEKNEAARKLRYEEHFPWVMEDFDNKNTWVSSYEAAQSNNYAVLTYDAATNGFKVVPIEKVYRMTPYARYATLSTEDAEERMERTNTMRDRWLMSTLQPRSPAGAEPAVAAPRDQKRGLRTVVGSEERQHKYTMDEEMDFDDQEMFDDDEGAPILDGPDDELKDAEERIKREQLKANQLMDAGNDEDIDKLFDDDQDKEGKQGRRLRKALRSLEKNQYYDTDDEENPYVSGEDSDSSIDELSAQQQQQQQQQQQASGVGAPELGATVKREEDDVLMPLISQFRKKHINKDALPAGMAVLQLPPAVLANFPAGEWYPEAKRVEAAAPSDQEDPRLLTRDDVRKHIVSGETEIKQLIMALKPKLVQHKDNHERLKTIVREIARSRDRKLYLR